MDNTLETLGLSILNIAPSNNEVDVKTDESIKIKFNSELDTSTIIGNILVLKDKNLLYTGEESLENLGYFQIVDGNISYKDKTIIFKPKESLDTNTRYIVKVNKDGIKDVTGKKLSKTIVSSFFSSALDTSRKVIITFPEYGTITDKMPVISWEHIETDAIIIQIAKDIKFKYIVYENILRKSKDNILDSLDISKEYDDGSYFLRIKSVNEAWSEITQFFIKSNITEKSKITDDDVIEDEVEIEEEEFTKDLVILDMYPKDKSTMVSTKTNIIYVKVMGEISLDDLDLNNSFVEGSLFAEEDEENNAPQGYLTGKWSVIYDEFEDCSYIIFTPNDIIKETAIYYTVTFCNYDGTVISEQSILSGEDAEEPEDKPERENYTFIGWDDDFTDITDDRIITAQFEENTKYTVIFYDYDEKTVLSEQNVYVGQSAIEPDIPTREGYIFKKWSKDFSDIENNLVIVAEYEKINSDNTQG